MKQAILNLGSGKELPLDLPHVGGDNFFLLNLDSGYYQGKVEPKDIESLYENWLKDFMNNKILYINENAFTFMEKCHIKFDKVIMYRFLEHIPKRDVLYFIYLVATCLNKGGIIDCIVPNYLDLAHRIIHEDPFSKDFEAEDIITTYELVNEPSCPHASIWTPDRIRKFFTLEGRFTIFSIEDTCKFDGRSIYLRATIERR